MVESVAASLKAFAAFLHLGELGYGFIRAVVLLGGVFVTIFLIEMWLGKDRERYFTRHFWNDMAYVLFYQGGFYNLLIGTALISALSPYLAFLRIEVLASLPAPAHFALYWVGVDFCDYWLHRAKHASRFLWAFHAVHHSQERMTFVTSWRFHPVEQVMANAVMLVPLLILGAPRSSWLPILVANYAFEAVQHAQLNWRYGPAYRLFVSPVFHAIHHSTEPRHHDRNYAKIFSLWDFLFGTAVDHEPAPVKTGISGPPIRETFSDHLVAPFRMLSRPTPAETVGPVVPVHKDQ